MDLVSHTSSSLITLFNSDVQEKIREIYNVIPGTLIKFLNQKNIVKEVKFCDNISASGLSMGTENHVNFDHFSEALRKSIKGRFEMSNVTEIQPETLSIDITKRFKEESKKRAQPGETIPTIIHYDAEFESKHGENWIKVRAHIYIYITEKCEKNWFGTNQYKFAYNLTIKLNGISVDKMQAIKFSELISRGNVADTIKTIEKQTLLTWNDL